jgi:hypothetical protein
MRIGKGGRNTWKKPAPVSICPPQIPFLVMGLNMGCLSGKLATNHLSYGMAEIILHVDLIPLV